MLIIATQDPEVCHYNSLCRVINPTLRTGSDLLVLTTDRCVHLRLQSVGWWGWWWVPGAGDESVSSSHSLRVSSRARALTPPPEYPMSRRRTVSLHLITRWSPRDKNQLSNFRLEVRELPRNAAHAAGPVRWSPVSKLTPDLSISTRCLIWNVIWGYLIQLRRGMLCVQTVERITHVQ